MPHFGKWFDGSTLFSALTSGIVHPVSSISAVLSAPSVFIHPEIHVTFSCSQASDFTCPLATSEWQLSFPSYILVYMGVVAAKRDLVHIFRKAHQS